MMGRVADARIWLFFVSACLFSVGCENLPWGSPKETADSATTSGASATASPKPLTPPVPPTELLATVNQTPISKTDMELRKQELQAVLQTVGQPWMGLSQDELHAQLDALINAELMAQDALARGLDRDLDVQRRFAYVRRSFFAQEWVRFQQDRLTVSAAEIEQHYNQFKMGYREPEQIRLRQLVVATEDEAKQALVKLLEGVDFAALAKQFSMGSQAEAGGLLEKWVMRSDDKAFFAPEEESIQSLDPVLEQAAFAIDKDGGYSNYVKGPDGRYSIFQRVEQKAPVYKPLTEVWDRIKNFLMLQKLDEAVEQLRTNAQIERFPERLEGLSQ